MLGRIDREIRERLASLTETVDFIETSEANPLTKYLEIDKLEPLVGNFEASS